MMAGSILFYILGVFVYSLPLGYFLIHLKEYKKFNLLPFFVRLTNYIVIGLVGMTFLLSIIGRILFNGYTIYLVFLCSCGCYLFILGRKILKKDKTAFNSNSPNWKANIIPFLLFMAVILYFSTVVDYLDWPPPGDSLHHGRRTARIIVMQKIPGITYPQGFHVLAATISLIFGIVPGEAMLVLGAAITALIPCILYSITYTNTSSQTFSLIPFLAAFVMFPGYLPYSTMGYFFLGSYTSVAGLLCILAFVVIISISDKFKNSEVISPQFLILFIIITAACFFVYTIYALFPIIYLITILIIHRKRVFEQIKSIILPIIRTHNIFLYIILTSGSVIFLILMVRMTFGVISLVSTTISSQTALDTYAANISYLSKDINGYVILLAVATIPLSLLKWRSTELHINILYLCTFVPIFLSLQENPIMKYLAIILPDHIFISLTSYLEYLYPLRTLMFLSAFSWIIFARFLHLVSQQIVTSFESLLKMKSKRKILRFAGTFPIIIIYLMIFNSLIPSLNTHISWSQTNESDWFTTASFSPHDFAAARWMAQNIPPEDIILNDLAYISFFLPSFSINNVVFAHPQTNRARAIECVSFWRERSMFNYEFLSILIEKYNIKYVFSASESSFFDFYTVGQRYLAKVNFTMEPRLIAKFLDAAPFLNICFQSAYSRVYEVVL